MFLNVPRTARSLSLAALRLFLLWIFFPPPCPIRRAVVITTRQASLQVSMLNLDSQDCDFDF